MNNIFLVAGVISCIYLVGKFIEMRYVEKEARPLKLLVRDALVVYFSVLLGNFILQQVSPVIEGDAAAVQAPAVFTDNPEF